MPSPGRPVGQFNETVNAVFHVLKSRSLELGESAVCVSDEYMASYVCRSLAHVRLCLKVLREQGRISVKVYRNHDKVTGTIFNIRLITVLDSELPSPPPPSDKEFDWRRYIGSSKQEEEVMAKRGRPVGQFEQRKEAVYEYLKSKAQELKTDSVSPSDADIAESLKVGPRQVARYISALKADGRIRTKTSRHKFAEGTWANARSIVVSEFSPPTDNVEAV